MNCVLRGRDALLPNIVLGEGVKCIKLGQPEQSSYVSMTVSPFYSRTGALG